MKGKLRARPGEWKQDFHDFFRRTPTSLPHLPVKFCRGDFPFLLLAGTLNSLISRPTLTFSEWMFLGSELYYNSRDWLVVDCSFPLVCTTPFFFPFLPLCLPHLACSGWSRHPSVMHANILVGPNPHRSVYMIWETEHDVGGPAWLR